MRGAFLSEFICNLKEKIICNEITSQIAMKLAVAMSLTSKYKDSYLYKWE